MEEGKSPFECYERGLVLKRVQMFQQAIENFQKAALDLKLAGRAYVHMALCFKASGNHEEAVTAFRKAFASPALSAEERRHILYHIGQTLESLGRYAESLEAYGKLRKENPEFRDVTKKIKRLCNNRRMPFPESETSWQAWMDEARTLTPNIMAFLEQTGQWLGWQADSAKGFRRFEKKSPISKDGGSRRMQPVSTFKRRNQTVGGESAVNARRHSRVPVRLRSQFSAEGRMVGGEGELRDLSPWGCRMTSAVAVPVGASLQCYIFPNGRGTPVIIEGATVRWISRQEFGLAFTNVHPGVQRQIALLCRAQAA
ncbi:MAG: tetratricopeptide repeat protein [Nitrospira sp.]|nr:tetratricopeptide repeat protein [Nitrospira sp.]